MYPVDSSGFASASLLSYTMFIQYGLCNTLLNFQIGAHIEISQNPTSTRK